MESIVIGKEPGMVCSIWAQNREALVTFLKETAARNGNVLAADVTFEFLPLPCGNSFHARGLDGIPYESVPCTCGDPTHWFVKYGQDRRYPITCNASITEHCPHKLPLHKCGFDGACGFKGA